MTADTTDPVTGYSIAAFDREDPETAMVLRRGFGMTFDKGFAKWLADPAAGGRYLFSDLHLATMEEALVNFDDEASLLTHIAEHCRKLTAAGRRFNILASPALVPKLERLRR